MEANGISRVQKLQQWGREWVMKDNMSSCQCKRNISIIKISIDLNNITQSELNKSLSTRKISEKM